MSQPSDRINFGAMFPVLQDYEYIQTYLIRTIRALKSKINVGKFVGTRFESGPEAK